ncbi:MAG: hypothetical protein ATN36_07885 [Epulopiscium sp. Nele67-Bin005]|nr:MAG: hypothetical protein ATN36_07885 [Epulopiscium sp. Nele67-Bin005]
MKTMGQKFYIAVFLMISCIPVLTMPFVKFEGSYTVMSNKAKKPEVISGGQLNFQYFEELNDYLADNFNGREALIEANATLMENIFSTSADSQVIVGQNDWLYFSATLHDFTGKNLLTDIEIRQIAKILSLIAEYVQSEGAKFIFTVAPNKNSIYPENMPANYLASNQLTNAQQLTPYLDPSYYVDLFKILDDSEEITYLKRDSHWNNYGAYLGFLAIMDKLELETNFNILNKEVRQEFEADLEGMLYPASGHFDEQVYYTFDTDFEFLTRFKTVEDIIIQTESPTGTNRMIVFRDSFGNALLDFFARQFEYLEFSRAVPYQVFNAAEMDYVVIEIVERNLGNLLQTAPIMPSILRESNFDQDYLIAENVTFNFEERNDLKQVYGYFEIDPQIEVEQIELILHDGSIFEAFPILESKLNLESSEGIQGFSLYLSPELSFENMIVKYR